MSNNDSFSWLKVNIIWIIALLGLLVGMITQWGTLISKSIQVDKIQIELEKHEHDTSIHIDPRRDDQRWTELLSRLDRIESKLDEKRNGSR